MEAKRKYRKARTKSTNMCTPCGNTQCDPMWPDTPAKRKIQARVRAGLCPGCGKKECTCKRKVEPMSLRLKRLKRNRRLALAKAQTKNK